MKLDYTKLIALDLRSKSPLHTQVYYRLYELILAKKISFHHYLPAPLALAKAINIPLQAIEQAYLSLIEVGFVETHQNRYRVSYHEFSHLYDRSSLPVEEALRQNGYEPKRVDQHVKLITSSSAHAIHTDFKGMNVHEARIDYYANEFPFGVTFNYTPQNYIKDFETFLNSKQTLASVFAGYTKTLTPKMSFEAITLPESIATHLRVEKGRSGFRLSTTLHGDQGQLMHYYVLYLTSWYKIRLEGKRS